MSGRGDPRTDPAIRVAAAALDTVNRLATIWGPIGNPSAAPACYRPDPGRVAALHVALAYDLDALRDTLALLSGMLVLGQRHRDVEIARMVALAQAQVPCAACTDPGCQLALAVLGLFCGDESPTIPDYPRRRHRGPR